MVKFRWFYNTDKETEWLNRMAKQGWAMTDFCLGFYHFERCEPGEYIYQADVAEKMLGVSEDYRQFMEETQTEIVCVWGVWVFLRRRAEEGPFQLYTDVESIIGYYTKMDNIFGTAEAIEAAGLLFGVFAAVVQHNPFGWALALMAGLFLLPFLWQTTRLKKILKELKKRREETDLQPEKSACVQGLLRGLVIMASLFGAIVFYVVLHELGHCIAVWLCGGTVTGFYPFHIIPHMTYEGDMPGFSQGLISIFGSAIPLAAAVLVLLFWKKSKRHLLLNTCAGIISGIFLMSTFAWIIEPIGRLMNRFDYSSDVAHFIDATGLHPAVVMLCALLIFGLTCLLFFKRRSRFSLEFVDGKFAARFLAFILTISSAFFCFLYFGSIGAETILAEGNVEYTVSGGKDPILRAEYEILVTEPGEYVCRAEWKLDRRGAVGGIVLKSEDEIFLDCTANWVDAEFHPVYLDSGSYTLCFYLLASEEDWLEYCDITGEEASGLSDYSWGPDTPATVTGKYRILRKSPNYVPSKSEGNQAAGGNQDG